MEENKLLSNVPTVCTSGKERILMDTFLGTAWGILLILQASVLS